MSLAGVSAKTQVKPSRLSKRRMARGIVLGCCAYEGNGHAAALVTTAMNWRRHMESSCQRLGTG